MDNIQALEQQLYYARRILADLEIKKAGYTTLTMPSHMVLELEDAQKKVAELEEKINVAKTLQPQPILKLIPLPKKGFNQTYVLRFVLVLAAIVIIILVVILLNNRTTNIATPDTLPTSTSNPTQTSPAKTTTSVVPTLAILTNVISSSPTLQATIAIVATTPVPPTATTTPPISPKTLSGHTNTVYSVAWSSPDGKTLASSSEDTTIRLWNVATGLQKGQPLSGHTNTVYSVAWSPDGKTLASGSKDTTIRLWDV